MRQVIPGGKQICHPRNGGDPVSRFLFKLSGFPIGPAYRKGRSRMAVVRQFVREFTRKSAVVLLAFLFILNSVLPGFAEYAAAFEPSSSESLSETLTGREKEIKIRNKKEIYQFKIFPVGSGLPT